MKKQIKSYNISISDKLSIKSDDMLIYDVQRLLRQKSSYPLWLILNLEIAAKIKESIWNNNSNG